MVRALVYGSRADAEAARSALDRDVGLPRDHAEGAGVHDFLIAEPGAAAERLRARGVRTEHLVEVIAHPDGTRFAVAWPEAGAIELDDSWQPEPRDR